MKAHIFILISFCILQQFSCQESKTKESSDKTFDDELKFYNNCNIQIGEMTIKDIMIYNRPIVFKKGGSHQLYYEDYVPEWFMGYNAVMNPSVFDSKEEFLKYLHPIGNQRVLSIIKDRYDEYKSKPSGVILPTETPEHHSLFVGIISMIFENEELFCVFGGHQIIINDMGEYEFTKASKSSKMMFYQRDTDGILKRKMKTIAPSSKEHMVEFLSVFKNKNIINNPCVRVINNNGAENFDSTQMPDWLLKFVKDREERRKNRPWSLKINGEYR